MARPTQGPWFRKSKNTWYVTINTRRVSLGVRGRDNRAAAVRAWLAMIEDEPPPAPPAPPPSPPPTPPPTPPVAAGGSFVRDAVEEFLADARGRLKPLTVGQYTDDLARFSKALGDSSITALTPALLTRWLAKMTCGPTTKGVRLRSVSAFFGWAVRMGCCPENPAAKVNRPKERSRGAEAVICEADRAKLLAKASPALRRVLIVLHGTGCRPGEAARITAADVREGVVVLTVHKSDGTGRPRIIALSAEAERLLLELAKGHPTGPLLRTKKGNPWTGRSITEAVTKLRNRVGVKAFAYGFRHTFATDALASGVPDATVAALLGHSSTVMLHKHYSHLTSRPDVLKLAVERVRRGATAEK